MASKPSHDKLIHCDACGEDYSATYRRCPFCGERNDPRRAVRDSAPPRDEDGQDDGYVFDGQDAFDDEADEEYYTPRPKAGKRLAPKQGGMELPPVNWPRLITFLCSLVIIVAALVIVFTVIYPQLHGSKDPKPDASQSQPPASQDPSSHPSSVVDLPTPPVEPTADLPPVDTTPVQPVLTGIALDKTDMTLWVGDSWQLKTTFTPADWSGAVSWTSSNPEWVTVSDTGLVTNVNASGKYHNAYITATVGDVSAQCVVRVQSRKQNDPPAQSPAPAASDPPSTATTTPCYCCISSSTHAIMMSCSTAATADEGTFTSISHRGTSGLADQESAAYKSYTGNFNKFHDVINILMVERDILFPYKITNLCCNMFPVLAKFFINL